MDTVIEYLQIRCIGHLHHLHLDPIVLTLAMLEYLEPVIHLQLFPPCTTLRGKTVKARGSGGKDLASTAYYPSRFCGAVFRAWNSEYLKDLERMRPLTQWSLFLMDLTTKITKLVSLVKLVSFSKLVYLCAANIAGKIVKIVQVQLDLFSAIACGTLL